MTLHRSSRRGVTLLECLVSITVFTVVALYVARAIVEGRRFQGLARTHAALVLRAQETLDLARRTPDLEAGTTVSGDGTTTTTTRVEPHPGGLRLVVVEVERHTALGIRPVMLSTLIPGGTP